MTSCHHVLVVNGVVSQPLSDTPPISLFLQNHSGAYTTSRTHNGVSSLLFWDRHLLRLANSVKILLRNSPKWFGASPGTSITESLIRPRLEDCLREGFPLALKERERTGNQEFVVTAFISANSAASCGFDSYVHFGAYRPPAESGARLAIVGLGREIAAAKHSEWVRRRKHLEKLRPPLATELLLSNDGDQILEGSVTNFFAVCRRRETAGTPDDSRSSYPFEVQTAPLRDGVLPGIIRQLIIEVCSRKGIPFQEVAPSWSDRSWWVEAFISNGLRLVQQVELIQAPVSWEGLQSKTWEEVSWEEKRFEGSPLVTTEILKEIMELANSEGYPIKNFF
ncbi:hypothetical protein H6P81_006226 [Aristolochia fimbriata]|uniref:Class IV aminotransferase n=1 Tax=Aristolochia fimbriata TaxID=158543 RepID=A0AAV7EWV6_ARIFI|nr:hypothetical protein H6P81_006226 [Aristolochia fimbriata]